jgi:hypothetical protein
MNTKNNVLAIVVLSIALLSTFSTVNAAEFKQYGTVGQEDQLYVKDINGIYWVNTGINYGIGNGSFEAINEINDNFTIDGAIKTFGIYEDTQQFIYEPKLSNGQFSNILFVYELVSFNHFQLTHIYADESGINEELTQLENNI